MCAVCLLTRCTYRLVGLHAERLTNNWRVVAENPAGRRGRLSAVKRQLGEAECSRSVNVLEERTAAGCSTNRQPRGAYMHVCVCTAAVNVDVLRFPSCRGATRRRAPLWFTCSAHVTETFPHYRKCTSQSGQKRSWKQRWHVHTTPELLNHHTVNSRVMFRLECILFWAVGIHKVFYFQAEKCCVCTSDCRDQAFISWEKKCWWSTGDKYTVNIITSARKRWRWHHHHHRAAETVTVLQVQSCRSSSAGPVLELLRHFFRTWFLHSWFWPSLISWRYEAAGRLHWGTQDWWEAAAVDHGSWMDVLSDWSTGDVSANGNMIRI